MKLPIVFLASLAACVLTGCISIDYVRRSSGPPPGYSVAFVSGNSAAVLIDYGSSPGELRYADAMAQDKCALFDKPTATLQSLNRLSSDTIRATYLCN